MKGTVLHKGLAAFSGFIIAVTVLINGMLGDQAGNYWATVIIHVTGLIGIVILLAVKKQALRGKPKVPLFFYVGGTIGVFTVVANIVTALELNITMTVALGLLGQTAASLVIDRFGWLGAEKQQLSVRKVMGVCFIALGIFVMLIW